MAPCSVYYYCAEVTFISDLFLRFRLQRRFAAMLRPFTGSYWFVFILDRRAFAHWYALLSSCGISSSWVVSKLLSIAPGIRNRYADYREARVWWTTFVSMINFVCAAELAIHIVAW